MNIIYRSRVDADYPVINSINIFGATGAAVAAAAASAAISAGVNAASASSAKKANKSALNTQAAQNEENKKISADTRDKNLELFDTAQKGASGYVQRATDYATGTQDRYAGQGGAAFDKLSRMMGVSGYGSQADADAANVVNDAEYQKQMEAYNQKKAAQLADYKAKMKVYEDQQYKRQEVENWYNSVGGQKTGMSLEQVMQAAGVGEAGDMPAWQDVGAAPEAGQRATYDPNYNSLNQQYGLEQYQNDPTYTPLVSNNLTREQYGQMTGVPKLSSNELTREQYEKMYGSTPFTNNKFTSADYAKLKDMPKMVSNTLDQEEYQQDPGYTPMVNTLEELEATPGYKVQLEQGMKGLQASQAARGGLLSGRAAKEMNNYAQGQASTGFQSAWERGQKAYADAFARKNQRFEQGQQGFRDAYGRNTLEYNQGEDAYNNEYNRTQQRFQQGQQGYADEYGRQTQRYAQGQDAYNNSYNRYKGDQDTQYNRLYQMSGMGQNSATTQGGYGMQGGALQAQNEWLGATNKARQNTDYSTGVRQSGQDYADSASNTAINNSQADQALYRGLGNSITDFAGAYASYRTPGSSTTQTPANATNQEFFKTQPLFR